MVMAGYVPPGPLYRCPKEKLLLHPCTCDVESDEGISVSCNNTNLASMSIGLNNLATFKLPVEELLIYKCHIGRLYGSLLYKLKGNNMTTLDRNAFGKLPVVFELNLANNNLRNINTRAFEGLLQVLVLNLTNNNLTHIPNGAFQGLVALQTLDLSHNKIAKLDNKTHGLLDDCLSLERVRFWVSQFSFVFDRSVSTLADFLNMLYNYSHDHVRSTALCAGCPKIDVSALYLENEKWYNKTVCGV
ncbi:hypothetical protein NQ317_001843 [Molorchus minor]|uniref:Uncharacterized protein n=1 Tax=Molorchus minor TaxID=1323400 RepID=A0ABQ9JYN3_9CUCU|nr:hypothetical protein NQ317_001843 [Molorchus minor]